MNTPVSYKLAKLLKEKGISFETEIYYSSVTKVTSVSYTEIAAPTIADVVMWLYEKHGIWIFTDYGKKTNSWYYNVQTLPESTIFWKSGLNTPTEAYEAAIEYTLNNLI